jgi:hypothetical protein
MKRFLILAIAVALLASCTVYQRKYDVWMYA